MSRASFAPPSPLLGYLTLAVPSRPAALIPSGVANMASSAARNRDSSASPRSYAPSRACDVWSSGSKPFATRSSIMSSSSEPDSEPDESDSESDAGEESPAFFLAAALAKAFAAFAFRFSFIVFFAFSMTRTVVASPSSSESSSIPSASALLFRHSASARSLFLVCTSFSSLRAIAIRRLASATALSTVGNDGSGAVRLRFLSSVRYRWRSVGVTSMTEAPSALARPVRPDLCT